MKMKIGLKSLTTIIVGAWCASMMTSPAAVVDIYAAATNNYGTDVVATMVSAVQTAPDGLATYQIAIDVDPMAGTNIVSGISGGESTDQSWGIGSDFLFKGSDGEYVDLINNVRVTNFNANGSSLTLGDLQNLSFKSVTVVNAQSPGKDAVQVVVGSVTNDLGNVGPLTGDPWAIDLETLSGVTAPVTDFSIGVSDSSSLNKWSVYSIQASVQFPDSWLTVDPSALSLELTDPATSVSGALTAAINVGFNSNNVEVISLNADSGFSAVISNSTLTPATSNETITVTYTNAGVLVGYGDVTNSTLVVTWTADGSGVTNTVEVPLNVTYKITTDGITAGQTIGIDFGETAPATTANFNFYSDVVIASNGVTESFGGILIDTSKVGVTGVGFSVQNNAANKDSAANEGATEGFGLMSDASIYGDGIILGNDTTTSSDYITLTFTGLDDLLTYDLTGGYDKDSNFHRTIWDVDGQSLTTAPTTTSGGFVSFTGLQTDGSGNLVITVTENGRYIAVAGLYLTAAAGSATAYDIWAAGFGLAGDDALPGADVENGGLGDGYDNLAEFALGMDPTVADAGSKESVGTAVDGGTNYFQYVYDRRTTYAADGLTYTLIDSDDLVSPLSVGTNAQDAVTYGSAAGDYQTVTNRYITADPVQFVELEIQQD
jgi:hypothetical protein